MKESNSFSNYETGLKVFFNHVKQLDLKPKVEQLAQLKMSFDESENLPCQVNSKRKFDIGPTNNTRAASD